MKNKYLAAALYIFFILGNSCYAQFSGLPVKTDYSGLPSALNMQDLKTGFFSPKPDIISEEVLWKIGIFAGPTFGSTSGNYTDYKTTCDYFFSGGKVSGFFADLELTIPLDNYSELMFHLGYQNNRVTLTQEKASMRTVRGEPDPVLLNMESQADFFLGYLDIAVLYKRYFLSDYLYFVAGPGLNYSMSAELEVKEYIKDAGFAFRSSVLTSDYIYPKGDLPDKSTIIPSVRFGLGYEFVFREKFIIAPQIIFSYPLGNITTTNTLKIININPGLQFELFF